MAEEKNESPKTDDQESEEKIQDNSDESGGGNLTSPEGILMLTVAGLLDGIGLIFALLAWLGIDDYGILDVLGAVIIGGWLYMRHGKMPAKAARRFFIAFGVEAIPFLGSISPSWIITVWQELKS